VRRHIDDRDVLLSHCPGADDWLCSMPVISGNKAGARVSNLAFATVDVYKRHGANPKMQDRMRPDPAACCGVGRRMQAKT